MSDRSNAQDILSQLLYSEAQTVNHCFQILKDSPHIPYLAARPIKFWKECMLICLFILVISRYLVCYTIFPTAESSR